MTGKPKSKLTALFFVRDTLLPTVQCSPAFKMVLLYMSSFANPDGSRIFASSRSIAAGTGYDRNTVRAAIKLWLEHGALILVHPGGGRGHAAEYRIAIEKGESLTPLHEQNGGTSHPFTDEKGVNKGVNPATHKGVNTPQKRVNLAPERGEQTGEPVTPTEAPKESFTVKSEETEKKNTTEAEAEAEEAAPPPEPAAAAPPVEVLSPASDQIQTALHCLGLTGKVGKPEELRLLAEIFATRGTKPPLEWLEDFLQAGQTKFGHLTGIWFRIKRALEHEDLKAGAGTRQMERNLRILRADQD